MEEQTRFIVFTAGFNSPNWVKKNILSVKKQNYSNYVHVIVDDATTDNTNMLLQKYKHDKLVIYRNEENIKWVKNALKYLNNHIESEEDVIIVVDLDDWLPDNNIFKKLNDIYTNEKVWLTYGNYAVYDGKKITEKSFKITKNKIVKGGSYIHLRTFKAFLWNDIKKEDLKGPDGSYVRCTYDRALMYPMIEMCPFNKIHQFKEIMYIYNSSNILSVRKIMSKNQKDLKEWFLNKPLYKELKR